MSIEIVLLLIVVVALVVGLRKVLGLMQDKMAAPPPAPALPGATVDELRRALQRGELPAPIDVTFRRAAGEECRAIADATIEQWLSGDDAYVHKSGGFAIGLTWIAARAVTNAAGNAARKARAGREAQERWREVGRYRVSLTDRRLIIEGGASREWHEIPLDEIVRVDAIGRAVEFQRNGGTLSRLHTSQPEYWYLLLRRLAFDEVPQGGSA